MRIHCSVLHVVSACAHVQAFRIRLLFEFVVTVDGSTGRSSGPTHGSMFSAQLIH